MKKLLAIAVLFVGLTSLIPAKVTAQTSVIALRNPNSLALDTASQAAAEGPKTLIVKSTLKTINLVVKTTKISGTIAGRIDWQGSNNNVDFATIDTVALADASKNYTYKEVDKGWLYYRALITQTGTSSLSYSGTYYTTEPKR